MDSPIQATAGQTTAAQTGHLRFERHFTRRGQNPYETVQWGRRDARAGSGDDAFFQADVEAPVSWSDQSVGIVAKLYFVTVEGSRENSVRQIISRVVGKLTTEGRKAGYFEESRSLDVLRGLPGFWPEDAIIFHDELTYMLLHQYVTFNTPVWLNLGVPGRAQCASACFLLSVDDKMLGENSITDWWAKEAKIFKMGAGSGVNVSNLRGSMEPLSTGGLASGPLAYIRTSDSGAGTLKSGGAHRRAAKLVRLDADHPDVGDFIQCKVREDERMRALQDAGFNLNPMTPEGERNIAECTSFQNQNISMGVTDAFMRKATGEDEDPNWNLIARKSGEAVDTVNASALLDDVAEAAWRCADPGLQFHDEINRWHTTPSLGPITTSNPCAETMLNDDSSCNLGTLNVTKFVGKKFDTKAFLHAVDVMVTAMDITCDFGELPTKIIEDNTRNLRQLGLGYTNMGSAIMRSGMAYDSPAARDFAASISALMTGCAYRRSAEIADILGPFRHFPDNKATMLRVIDRHIEMLPESDEGSSIHEHPIWGCVHQQWKQARDLGHEHGYRNSQVTLVQPGGTTSFMVGADTTGIEPAIALVSYKALAGGGTMKIVNSSVKHALENLGYNETAVGIIYKALETGGPEDHAKAFDQVLQPEHRGIFQTAIGEEQIPPIAHIKMVAAVQPFLSQSVSKTVNMPNSATVEDVRNLYVEAWRLGLKAVSIYRDGSKATQVLTTTEKKSGPTAAVVEIPTPVRRRMPRRRNSFTTKFEIDGHEGYLTAGMHEDGTLGEVFLNGVGKDGSTLRGMADMWATSFSIGLQYGVPLETFVRKYINTSFPPTGLTTDPVVPSASSIGDYIARNLAAEFLDTDTCDELGVLTPEVKQRIADRLDAQDNPPVLPAIQPSSSGPGMRLDAGPACKCGAIMQRAGACWRCPSCGAGTGCG